MRDVLPELMRWWRDGDSVGVGTVVATFRSAPRPAGASMLVGPGGEAVGSVSGGCVEGAVYELGQEVVASGSPVLQRYGVSDDDAFAVGLTCGGILDVFVESVSRETFPELGAVSDDIESGRPVAVATTSLRLPCCARARARPAAKRWPSLLPPRVASTSRVPSRAREASSPATRSTRGSRGRGTRRRAWA